MTSEVFLSHGLIFHGLPGLPLDPRYIRLGPDTEMKTLNGVAVSRHGLGLLYRFSDSVPLDDNVNQRIRLAPAFLILKRVVFLIHRAYKRKEVVHQFDP